MNEHELLTRIHDEVAHAMHQSSARRDAMLKETIFALWAALDDASKVQRHTHPTDVLQKYLLRGNITPDGDWNETTT